jgi:hypothetical protein
LASGAGATGEALLISCEEVKGVFFKMNKVQKRVHFTVKNRQQCLCKKSLKRVGKGKKYW